MSVQTVALANDQVSSIALVGKIVTYPGSFGQFKVNCVEGATWFAVDKDGETVVDLGMTPAPWITEPLATIVPVGHKIGEGFAQAVSVKHLVRGVNLSKGAF